MKNEPEKYDRQVWSLPIEPPTNLVRDKDDWYIEIFYGGFRLTVDKETAINIALYINHYQERTARDE